MRSFKRFASILALAAGAALLTGCGAQVEVPPAYVGKIMTKDGYQEAVIPTSKFRLAPCWNYCDKLVLLNAADTAYTEELSIFIPEDKLNLKVKVRATLSIDPTKVDSVFNSVAPTESKDGATIISNEKVYATYAAQILQAEVREYLSKYSISEIASSNEKINADLSQNLGNTISKRTPFQIRHIGIVDLAYPKIITDAQESAAERREAVQKEEAQLAISKAQLERELQEARLQRAIEKEKAETEATAQKVLAESVDSRVLELRRLEIQRINAQANLAAAGKWNGQQPQSVTTIGGAGGQIPLMLSMPAPHAGK